MTFIEIKKIKLFELFLPSAITSTFSPELVFIFSWPRPNFYFLVKLLKTSDRDSLIFRQPHFFNFWSIKEKLMVTTPLQTLSP